MGRKLRCTLDLIHPNLKKKVEAKQTSQKTCHDKHARTRNFGAGEPIYTKNYGYGPKWIPGLIHETTGPVSYTVLLGDGKLFRRHVDLLFSRQVSEPSVLRPELVPEEECVAPKPMSKTRGQDTGSMQEGDRVSPTTEQESRAPVGSPTRNLLRPQRNRKPPAYMKDFFK